jgi:hypothetical protein
MIDSKVTDSFLGRNPCWLSDEDMIRIYESLDIPVPYETPSGSYVVSCLDVPEAEFGEMEKVENE